MVPSFALHELIRVMDKQERIYFKARFLSGRDLQSRLLFEEIERQKVYNEAALKKRLENQQLAKRFSQVKNYLYHQVLESLALFHADKTDEAKARMLCDKAGILLRKGMSKEASRLLKRAVEIASATGDHLLYLHVLEMQGETFRALPANLFDRETERHEKNVKKVLSDYINQREYLVLDNKVYNLRRKHLIVRTQEDRKLFLDFLKHPLLKNRSLVQTHYARFLYYSIKGSCYHQTGDFKRSLQIRAEELQMLEPLAATSILWLHRYSSALYQVAIAWRQLENPARVFPLLRRIYQLKEKFPKVVNRKSESVFFKRAAMLETDMYVHYGDTESGLKRIPAIEEELKRHGTFVDRDIEMVIQYNMALIGFMAGDLKLAQRKLYGIINKNEKAFAEDLVCFARIMNLIIHIELNNTDLLYYISKQTQRFLQKRKHLYKTEGVILDFCSKLLRANRRESDEQLFSLMEKELKNVMRQASEKNVIEFFDFNAWLKARKEGKTMGEVIAGRK